VVELQAKATKVAWFFHFMYLIFKIFNLLMIYILYLFDKLGFSGFQVIVESLSSSSG